MKKSQNQNQINEKKRETTPPLPPPQPILLLLLVLSSWPIHSIQEPPTYCKTPKITITIPHLKLLCPPPVCQKPTTISPMDQHHHYSSSSPSFPMGQATITMRKSIFIFLQKYQFFTSTPSLLALPFAVSTLLSQSLISSSYLFPLVHGRLKSLFLAAGFPPASELFAILNLKLTQTILTFLFVLPFTLSFLLLAKGSIIRALECKKHGPSHKNPIFSWIMMLNPLLITQLCNSLVILSANATCFCILIIFFNLAECVGLSSPGPLLLLSATGAIVYSIILANAYIICNLSLIVSGSEKQGGFSSILKACVMVWGRTATALSLAVPINMALAAVEALFQYRIVRAYHRVMAPNLVMVLEAMLIAYLYAMLLVLDTVVGFVFLKSCKSDNRIDEEETLYIYRRQTEMQERDEKSLANVKALELVL